MKSKVLLIAFTICGAQVFAQTNRITFKTPMLYPEGVAYDSKSALFFVGSVKTGTIGTVDAQGLYKVFYSDSTLKSTFGMKVNLKNNTLWVCAGDPNYSKYSDSSTFKKLARIIGISIATGKKIADHDLSKLIPGKHFLNDMTLDPEGNLFITDSFSPAIYKIDGNGNASVFAKSDLFRSLDVGLNGIVYHPEGFLLVAHSSDGCVLKVSIKDPTAVSRVKTGSFFPGIDGLLIDDHKNLIVIQNKGVDKAFQLSSTDQWKSAVIKAATAAADMFQNPTTATLMDTRIFVLNSKMNELSDSTKMPSKEFSIQQVQFKSVQ